MGPQRFLEINMLVSATRNAHVGGRTKRELFDVLVEYRLYC